LNNRICVFLLDSENLSSVAKQKSSIIYGQAKLIIAERDVISVLSEAKNGRRRHGVERHGQHRHLAHTVEIRRQQAPAAGKSGPPALLGRANVSDALERDWMRMARLIRRFVLEPYARWRQRSLTIAQLRSLDDRLLDDIGLARGDIERTVDAILARQASAAPRPVEGREPEQPRAAHARGPSPSRLIDQA
jgi:uncharacterized protein YjiS (DUF1127 family)